jgi:hypothetical protein
MAVELLFEGSSSTHKNADEGEAKVQDGLEAFYGIGSQFDTCEYRQYQDLEGI